MKKQLFLMLLFTALAFASEPQQSFWETYTAALRGDKIAQFQVGVIYERGIGIDSNQSKAAYWYEKSASQGYVDAQYNIAIMYATGRGVEMNEGAAMMWLALAAKQKDKESRKLLLKFIDGELDDHKTKSTQNSDHDKREPSVLITPVTLITKEGAMMCDKNNQCTPYKVNTTVTSMSKNGTYYKISGIATKKGWEAYEHDGWIHENSVDIRR